jgi:hypothetical protein
MVAGVQYRASVLPALNPMDASGSGLPPALQPGCASPSCGMVSVSQAAVQVRDKRRLPSSASDSSRATASVLVESRSNYVRLDAAWIADWKRRERTRRWSRLAIASCGMVSLLAASCSTFSLGNTRSPEPEPLWRAVKAVVASHTQPVAPSIEWWCPQLAAFLSLSRAVPHDDNHDSPVR